MLARLMPGGEAGNAASELGNLVPSLAATKEAHHFHPLLFYFRFHDPRYAVSRFGFVLLDLVTLIDTVLDHDRYAPLIGSAPVASLRRGTLLLESLDANFPTSRQGARPPMDFRVTRRAFLPAVQMLEKAGIAVRHDGADDYVGRRQLCDALTFRVAPAMGYTPFEIYRRAATA